MYETNPMCISISFHLACYQDNVCSLGNTSTVFVGTEHLAAISCKSTYNEDCHSPTSLPHLGLVSNSKLVLHLSLTIVDPHMEGS